MQKKSPSAHHRTTLSGCIFTTKACINNRKKNLLNSNISSTCHHNMVNFSALTAEITRRVLGTSPKFQWLASWLHCCTDLAQPRSTKLCTMFGCLLGWYTIHFWELLPPNGILPGAKFTLHPSLASLYWQHYCMALEQWALAKLCIVVPSRNRAVIPFDIGRLNCLVDLCCCLILKYLSYDCISFVQLCEASRVTGSSR